MFGIALWKWFLAAVGLTLIGALGIPAISPLADVLSIIPCLVLFLALIRFLWDVFGFHPGGGSYNGDATFRRLEKQRAADQRTNERYQQKFRN